MGILARAWYRVTDRDRPRKLREEVDDTYHKVNRVRQSGEFSTQTSQDNPVYMKDVAVESHQRVYASVRTSSLKIGESSSRPM